MKNLKVNIDEALFSGNREDIVNKIDSSYTLQRLPKTPQEYLNYMCAWNNIHNAVYDMKTESGEFLAYIFRIYFENIPDFHLVDKVPYSYSKYDIGLDDILVEKGPIKFNKAEVNRLLDELMNATDKSDIIELRSKLRDISYALGKLGGFTSSYTPGAVWLRAAGIAQPTVYGAKLYLAKVDSKYLRENAKQMLTFVDEFKNAMEKGPYREEAKQYFKTVYQSMWRQLK
jgi:hypothetical protein